MNRRDLIKALAAGGVMTAAGLWMPGKLISIPKPKIEPANLWGLAPTKPATHIVTSVKGSQVCLVNTLDRRKPYLHTMMMHAQPGSLYVGDLVCVS